MNRKSNQVSLEPYGYTLVPRVPSKTSKVEIMAVKQEDFAPAPFEVTGLSAPTKIVEAVQPPTPKTGNSAGCIATVIVAVVGIVFFAVITSGSSGSNSSSYSASNNDAGLACVMAEKLIKPQLKAPSTAEFDYGDCKDSATRSGDTWTLRSYIDADNSFGAHIRTRYFVKMKNVPPSDMWYMTDLSFDEP